MLIILILAVLFTLAVMCRRGHKGLKDLQGWAYAHRGLHSEGVPENSLAAFRAAVEAGYGAELDVHLLKDGSLVVFHDGKLERMTGKPGRLEDLTAADLTDYPLVGTAETIPLFSQVLEVFNLLDGYKGVYCLESFDPRCVHWLKKNRPDLIRGQLAENFFHSPDSPLPGFMKFLLSNLLENFLILPDFVAYKFADRKTPCAFLARKIWGAQGVSWTITRQEDFDTAVKEGWIPIFEGFKP